MRSQLWLLVAFVAGNAAAVPAGGRPTRGGGTVNYADPDEDGNISTDGEFDPEDVFGATRGKPAYGPPEWEVYPNVKVTFDNNYPSYGTWDGSVFKGGIYDHTGIRKVYYDYDRDPSKWVIERLKEETALKSHTPALSKWRMWPKGAKKEDYIKAMKFKNLNDRCPSFSKDDWEKAYGFQKGQIVQVPTASTNAGMYNSEHVYEKQILKKFFADPEVFKNQAEAEWFKVVATDDLNGLENGLTNDANKWGKGAYYTFEVCLWHDNKYKSLRHIWNTEPQSRAQLKRFLPPMWGNAKAAEKDSLIQALASVVGSNYRPDHLTLLEYGLNQYKGKVFGKHALVKDRLENWEKEQCINNPFLLLEPHVTKLADAKQDDESLYLDRLNTLRQGVMVWQYFELEWDRFASTSRAIYQLLKKFDDAYKRISAQDDDAWKVTKKLKPTLSNKWRNRPGGDFKFADKYKEFLPRFMEDVITVSEINMGDQRDWMEQMDFQLGNNNAQVPGVTTGIYTQASLFDEWDTYLQKYSKTAFWDQNLKQKVINECFEVANAGAADATVGECVPASTPTK